MNEFMRVDALDAIKIEWIFMTSENLKKYAHNVIYSMLITLKEITLSSNKIALCWTSIPGTGTLMLQFHIRGKLLDFF